MTRHAIRRLLAAGATCLCILTVTIGCPKPADDTLAGGDETASVSTPTHQLAAKQAIVAGDTAAALAALQQAVDAAEPVIDPITLMGGWLPVRQLHTFPPSDDGPAAAALQTALTAFESGDSSAAAAALTPAMTGDHARSDAYSLYALHSLKQGKTRTALGAISKGHDLITDHDDPDQVWLNLLARCIAYDRDGRPAAAQRFDELAAKSKFHPQRAAIADFYAARQAVIAGKTDDATLLLAEVEGVWGPQYQEENPRPTEPLPDDMDLGATEDL